MYILKIGLVLLTGAGFGFGVDRLADTEMFPKDEVDYYEHMDENYCHSDGDFLEHMLNDLSDEDRMIVQDKVELLLVEYAVTLETLNDDYDVRYDFMTNLMEFLDDNEIEFYNHNGFNHHSDDTNFRGGMGMH